MIENKKDPNGWLLHFEFHLFGGKPSVTDSIVHVSKSSAKAYYDLSKWHILTTNFERYIFLDNGKQSEDAKKSRERLLNANRYFNETEGLSMYKCCDMILKIQKEMLSLLSTKNENYGKNFSYFNDLIGFCKAEITNQTSDNTSKKT